MSRPRLRKLEIDCACHRETFVVTLHDPQEGSDVIERYGKCGAIVVLTKKEVMDAVKVERPPEARHR